MKIIKFLEKYEALPWVKIGEQGKGTSGTGQFTSPVTARD